ncbi:MAG TPA: hypothetical protein VE988_29680, partial [Gemmataceae bacterium]|nr:hypothetical protein [Gemmataceae bacterium]
MLVEALLFLIVLVILVALAVCIVVLPLVALARTRHIGELVQRVDDLERTVRRLRVGNAVPEPIAKSPAAQPESIAKTPESPHEEIPVVTPARRPRPAVPEVNLEAWIGGRALGWIAVVLLIFAAAFFLRHVFEHGL